MRTLLTRTAAAAVLLSLVFSLGCVSDKGVAAKVNGKRIYIQEIQDMIKRYVAISRKLDPAYAEPSGQVLENMRRQFLDGLVDKALIMEKAREYKLAVPDSELNQKIDLLKKSNEIMDEAAFGKYLKDQGISEAEFKNNIRDIMLMEKTRDRFFSEVVITEEEAQNYYKVNGGAYAQERMRAAHIIIKSSEQASEADKAKALKKAETVLAEAKAGRDFAALAKKYSEDPSAAHGGDLGEFARNDMVPEFDAVVFTLKKDQIAGPVKTRFGYHVIKALSDPQKVVSPYDTVKDAIRNALLLEKRKAKLASLRQTAKIKVLWDCKS